ncbi:MAG: thioredoxin family protein [Pedobacter sp.]|nr:MAG: thioredoxin family protein [Pedobacter sp.]
MKKIVLVCMLLFTLGAYAQTGYKVGDVVADFKLKNVNNQFVSLTNYPDAKGYIIVFTCNTCPVSKAYQDRIEDLNKTYKPKGYPVIAINTNDPIASPGDSFPKMQELAKQKNTTYPYLEDPDHIYTKLYGAAKTPHTFIVQKTEKGNELMYYGAIDNDQENTNPQKETYVADALELLMKGKKPAVNFTKAVGCTIKWKKN